jgi:hypothetical protein
MSSLTQPRGPLPARVYWTRRLILLAVATLLLVTLARVLTGGSDGKTTDGGKADKSASLTGATTTGSGSPSTTGPTGAAAATTTASGKPGGKVPLAAPSGPCDPEKLVVTPEGGRQPNDGHVAIVLSVSTPEEACTFQVSPKTVVLKIVSGADNIWSSQQCVALPTKDVIARKALPAEVTFDWNGRRSDEDCSRSAGWATPGYYHAIAATLGGEPADVQFALTRPPAVVVTVTPKPKPSPTASSTH